MGLFARVGERTSRLGRGIATKTRRRRREWKRKRLHEKIDGANTTPKELSNGGIDREVMSEVLLRRHFSFVGYPPGGCYLGYPLDSASEKDLRDFIEYARDADRTLIVPLAKIVARRGGQIQKEAVEALHANLKDIELNERTRETICVDLISALEDKEKPGIGHESMVKVAEILILLGRRKKIEGILWQELHIRRTCATFCQEKIRNSAEYCRLLGEIGTAESAEKLALVLGSFYHDSETKYHAVVALGKIAERNPEGCEVWGEIFGKMLNQLDISPSELAGSIHQKKLERAGFHPQESGPRKRSRGFITEKPFLQLIRSARSINQADEFWKILDGFIELADCCPPLLSSHTLGFHPKKMAENMRNAIIERRKEIVEGDSPKGEGPYR